MRESPLDESLRHLVDAARSHPSGSRERRRALAQLISVLQRSKQLTRPHRGQFQGFYEDIYQEALQRLFTYVCDRIDDYNAERGRVLQWVNFLLSRRFFIEASREVLPTVPKGIDAKTVKRLSLEELDSNQPSELDTQLAPSLSEDLKRYIQEDPERLFQTTCVEKHPSASFQYIALRRLDGYSWKEISTELGVRIPTLSSFYQRCITRFAPQCKQDLLLS